jgi:hypothetical protein
MPGDSCCAVCVAANPKRPPARYVSLRLQFSSAPPHHHHPPTQNCVVGPDGAMVSLISQVTKTDPTV